MNHVVLSLVTSVLQLGMVGVGGLLLLGFMAKVKARAEGRVGSPVVQPLRDVRKLVTKERLHARHSSVVLPLAPMVITASITCDRPKNRMNDSISGSLARSSRGTKR